MWRIGSRALGWLSNIISNIQNGEKQDIMRKEVMLVTGAGQISMAIARRIGFGKKIILGDKKD